MYLSTLKPFSRIAITSLLSCSIVLGLILSPKAIAGVWLQTGVLATDSSEEIGGTTVDSSRFSNSTTLGYAFPQGFMVGGQVLYDRTSLTGDHDFGWGPKGGLLLKGFELSAAYLIVFNSYKSGFSRTGGGIALNGGYHFHLSKVFLLGLQMTYWISTLNEQDGIPFVVKPHDAKFLPLLSFALEL